MTLLCRLTVFSQSNETPSYDELIVSYQKLVKAYPANAKLLTGSKTDCGRELQLFVLSDSGRFDAEYLKKSKCILFILNGIHPGEPDGINASLAFAKELLENQSKRELLRNVAICIVPAYNIDGALRRSCCSRANQNGPKEYGFRGNARNLDLNRDFLKADTRNAKALEELLRKWNPDVFVDTHVSDGSDYQYTITLISSQHSKMNPVMGNYMKKYFTPALFEEMKKRNSEAIPYVDTYSPTGLPDSGIVGFFESPRFSSGYQSLFNCFSFITETHMLKPFDDRVKATQTFIEVMANYCANKKSELKTLRTKALIQDAKEKFYALSYDLDTTKYEMIPFKGYTGVYSKSNVTGLTRLQYDHQQPYEKQIRFYDKYEKTDSIEIPSYYVIPQAWEEVVQRLELNKIKMIRLKNDTSISGKAYYIDSLTTSPEPYEGHYLHSTVKTKTLNVKRDFHRGDFLIPVRQENMRYLIEALEPRGADSYFAWGFFDAILQQKEWFSPYVFENIAADLLEKDQVLRNQFDVFKKENPAAGSFDQLYFIYKNSPYFEKETFRIYPILRVM